ncbi:MAG: transketolase family protein [Chloroflexi bacterium]|nr:transketolase family protein [Chloroflexota bacterium]
MSAAAGIKSIREAYGKALVQLGQINPNVVVLDADLSKSTMTRIFAQEFPKRFFDMGLAEQNLMSVAAGLAASGKIPFASTFAVFATGRAFDQLRVSIAQPGLNVKIVATHGGITVGEDGASHHAIEDLALACALPGFTVIVPADAPEAEQAVVMAAQTSGPFYIRLARPSTSVIHGPGYRFHLGQAEELRSGGDATIIALGLMVVPALEAAVSLEAEGIRCRVLNMATLKPLDTEAVVRAARETGAIVTAEEHLQHGGLGSAVAQATAQACPVPMGFVAIRDVYTKSGKAEELLRSRGLTARDIAGAVRAVVARKGR